MTPDECNQVYEVLMMIDSSLELIINRAQSIRKDAIDPHLYVTQLKSNSANNAKDILDMAESIEKRKGPAFKMIAEQRKNLKSQDVDFSTRASIMKEWDRWRKYIAEGGKSSWPRDAFESLLDFYEEKIEEQRKGKNIVIDKPTGNERPFPV